MLSNLPPGVTVGMIPGNWPEDKEVGFTIVLTMGELDDLQDFLESEEDCQIDPIIQDILEQLKKS